MQRRVLGSTGLSIGTFALGTMMFGPWGESDERSCARMVAAAIDGGVTLIDTADMYSDGESERLLGAALKGRRDEVVLATKFGLPMGDDPNRAGGSARWIKQAVDDSLRRLDTDRIDLYQMHRPDYDTDLEATLGALDDLVRAGKVRYIGESMYPADRLVEAQWTATTRGTERFRTEQLRYSLLSRAAEEWRMPAAQRYGMGVITFGPLSSGWLSGRTDPTSSHRARNWARSFDMGNPANVRRAALVAELERLAADSGLTMIQLALGFVLAHPAVTAAIIGPRTPEQLGELLAVADVELDAEVLDRIDAIVAPGADVNPDDNFHAEAPALLDARLRRR